MKNSLNISVAGEDLISTVDDSTNRLFINGTEVPSTSWTGSGTYSTTVNGHAITITQVEDTTGNVAIRRTAAYTYELYKIKTGTTIDGDLIVTGSISEDGVKLEDKYGGKMTLLWTNPNPTSDFVSQDVILSDRADNYDLLAVVSRYAPGVDTETTSMVYPSGNQMIWAYQHGGSSIAFRPMNNVGGTTFEFGSGWWQAYNNSQGTGAQVCIPERIYGIKF